MRTFDKFFILEKGDYPNIDNMKDDNKDALNGYLEDDDNSKEENKMEERIMKAARLVVKKSLNKNGQLKKYCEAKNYSPGNEKKIGAAIGALIDIFSETEKLDLLDKLLENKGFISINELKAADANAYLFDLLKSSDIAKGEKDLDELFTKLIDETIQDGKNNNAGRGEFFLINTIKECHKTDAKGDVGFNGNSVLEVKGNSARPSGQKDVGNVKSLYEGFYKAYNEYVETNLSDKKDDLLIQKKEEIEFLHSATVRKQLVPKFDAFLDAFGTDSDKKLDAVMSILCEAILTQYKVSGYKPETLKKVVLQKNKTLIENILNGSEGESLIPKGSVFDRLKNIIGCIELYCYYKIEKFQRIIVLGVNNDLGHYFYCNKPGSQLLNFTNVLSAIKFYEVGESKHSKSMGIRMGIKGDSTENPRSKKSDEE